MSTLSIHDLDPGRGLGEALAKELAPAFGSVSVTASPQVRDDVTHAIVISAHPSKLRQVGKLPEQPLTYLWIDPPSRFLPSNRAEDLLPYDFVVATGNMAARGLRELVLSHHAIPTKQRFRLANEIRAIRPGVDQAFWKPSFIYNRGFGREEIRQALFNGRVSDRHFLVCGVLDQYGDPSTFFATVQRLRRTPTDLLHAVLVMRAPTDETLMQDLRELAEGSFLEPNEVTLLRDVSPEKQRLIYQASGLFLETSTDCGWSLSLVQAMACGCLVAAPDEHLTLEIIDEGRGIELPTGLFETSHVGWESTHGRRVLPQAAAEAIGRQFNPGPLPTGAERAPIHELPFRKTREAGTAWASTELTWKSCANEWLELIGV